MVSVVFTVPRKMACLLISQVSDGTQDGTKTCMQGPAKGVSLTQCAGMEEVRTDTDFLLPWLLVEMPLGPDSIFSEPWQMPGF